MIKIIKWVGVSFLIFVLALGLLGCGGSQGYNSPATGNIAGTVKDEAHVAIVGATVVVEEADLSATTDADGYYLLENIPVGTYNIAASADNYYPQTAAVTVEKDKIATQDFIPQAIQPYTAYIVSGTVTDKDTEGPLGGATVTIEGTGWSATTEDDGSYSISDVEADTYNITASKSGYTNQTETVTVEGDITVDFELIALVQYNLTIDSTAGVSVTTPGEGTFTYEAGTVVDLVATPGDGYRFVEWTGDVGTIADIGAAATNITMNGNYVITATSVAVYDLAISSTEGGSVTTPGEETFTYDAGTVVDLVAEVDDGYRFVEWTGDVGTIADVGAAATNITMKGDYSITAEFVKQYDLTISSTEGGSVTTPGEGVLTYDAGTVVDLVAEVDDGYWFVEWTGDVGTIADVGAAATNITMSGNYSITASFVIEATPVRVDSITYKTEGGRNKDKHLNITVLLLDDLGEPVAGASVFATLYREDESSWNFQGTTDLYGTVTFRLTNHGSGCYWTVVTDVQAEGLEWDGVTPENGYCKK
jgi:hypothetical protein